MLLTDTLEWVRARLLVDGKRAATIDEYLDEADGFARWFERVESRAPEVSDLTVVSADRYILALTAIALMHGRPWSNATRQHHVVQLRAFAGHLAVVCGLTANPLAGLSAGRRAARREGDALDDHVLIDLLEVPPAASNSYDLVTRAIIAVGYEVGPRTSELAAMDVADFQIAVNRGVELGPIVLVAAPAKSDRKRVLPLGVRAEEIVRRVVGNRTAGPLFPGRDGGPMTADALESRVARAGKKSRVRLSPQRLR